MHVVLKWITRGAEFAAAMMMAAMFATFVLQILIRYTARLEWLAEAIPILDPSRYGWTLELNLALWVWIIFLGSALIVRERDHLTFDILYTNVSPVVRKWFAVITGVTICVVFLSSLEPTWDKFYILRLKKTATLSAIFGDGIRMRDIYSIYLAFLLIVGLRYGWRAWVSFRHGAESDLHHYAERSEELTYDHRDVTDR
jgi:C4-dicarboxylate transporter DctQ subunit